jgi:uncharacterized protein (DUF1697 family)
VTCAVEGVAKNRLGSLKPEGMEGGQDDLGADRPVRYVAFLRGVNVGGHKPVKMADLRAAFESMGFQKVKTVLASGNVVFETLPGADLPANGSGLAAHIEQLLQETFGYPIAVALRTMADLQRLAGSDPFKGAAITQGTRLYITFLSDSAKSTPDFAYDAPEGDLRIVRVGPGEVCSLLTLSPTRGTTDLMALLEREFGGGVTTRNWNTVVKVLEG